MDGEKARGRGAGHQYRVPNSEYGPSKARASAPPTAHRGPGGARALVGAQAPEEPPRRVFPHFPERFRTL